MTTNAYLGDLQKTAIIADLFAVPHTQRNSSWLELFFANVADASFQSGDPQVFRGPDGLSYFRLRIPEAGKPFECFVIRHLIKDFLLTHGLGLVLESGTSTEPSWVFSHGDLVGFSIKSSFEPFVVESPATGDLEKGLEEDAAAVIGQPSENLLPTPTRQVLRRFLQAQGIKEPKVFLMIPPGSTVSASERLIFNVDSTDALIPAQELLQWIGWFLPRGYILGAAREEQFKESFQPL